MTSHFPSIPSLASILERLALIYPEGTENRSCCIRESTAKTVQVMLYAGALSGTDRWIRPSQVTDMSDAQIAQSSAAERKAWQVATLSSARRERPKDAWYAPNSREQIRDENIRQGLIPNNGAVERAGFSPDRLTYVTAFSDRDAGPYKTLAPNLAWDSFVWFASEPDAIVSLKSGSEKKLSELR